jgi:hypothetical protein
MQGRLVERTSRLPLIPAVARLFMIAVLFVYGAFLRERVAAYIGGSDSSGCMSNARLLSEHKFIVEQRIITVCKPNNCLSIPAVGPNPTQRSNRPTIR